MPSDLIPVFDGHNDTLLRLVLAEDNRGAESFFVDGKTGHIDRPRARKGGSAAGVAFSPCSHHRGWELTAIAGVVAGRPQEFYAGITRTCGAVYPCLKAE